MTYPQPPGPPPPGGSQPPPYGPPPAKRKVWPWVLGGLAVFILIGFVGCVAVLGTVANEVSGTISSTPQAPALPAPGDPGKGTVTVRYEVSGPAMATNISYVVDEAFQLAQANGEPLPWAFEAPFPDSTLGSFLSVTAQSGDDGSGEITCRILRAGEVIAENTSSGPYAVVSCNGA